MLLLLMNMGFAGGGTVVPPVDAPAFDGGWGNYPEAREAFRKAAQARKLRKETPDELHVEIEEVPEVTPAPDVVSKRSEELAKVSQFLRSLSEASELAAAQARERQALLKKELESLATLKNTELGNQLAELLEMATRQAADHAVQTELKFIDNLSAAKVALENSIEGFMLDSELNGILKASAEEELDAQLAYFESLARLKTLRDPSGELHQAMLEDDDEEALLLL